MTTPLFSCRVGCGACCIAPSISSPIPGMPQGKAAGVRCCQLDEHNRCKLFGQPERPQVCSDFDADVSLCSTSNQRAFELLTELETLTNS